MAYNHDDFNWKVWGAQPTKKAETPKRDDSASSSQGSGSGSGQTATAQEEKPREPHPKEYEIKSLTIIEPANGFERFKPFDFEGTVEKITDKISRPRIIVYLMGNYMGKDEIIETGGSEVFIDEKTLTFKGTIRKLFNSMAYDDDRYKADTAIWEMFLKAEGNTAKETFVSGKLTFPQVSKFQELKKWDYDDNGADKSSKEKTGPRYKPGSCVKAMQKQLITTGFLPKGSDDGYFGPKTEEALQSFQSYAILAGRMKLKEGTVKNTDKKLTKSNADGVFDKLTYDELTTWVQDGFVKPVPTIREGEIDDKGAENRKGEKGADNHHTGTPVSDLQNYLAKIGAYTGKIDGWFGEKMKAALKLFLECEEKGSFKDTAGKPVTIPEPERKKEQLKTVASPAVQETVKKRAEAGLKVDAGAAPYGGYELKQGDNDKLKKWGGEVRQGDGEFVKEIQKDLLRLGYWVSKPDNLAGKGMNCDGDLGTSTENAIKTFQLEHFVINANGNLDAGKKSKITGVVDKETAKKLKEKIKNIGNKKWDRPGHKPHAKWQEPAGTGTYTPNKEFKPDGVLFYQLPPSEGYYRRATVEYGSKAVLSRKTNWRCTPYKVFDDDDCAWLMADCWGTKEQIDLLKNIGDTWLTKEDGKPRTVKDSSGKQRQVEPFGIGDISGFNGGVMACHAGHSDGNSTDLNRSDTNPMCHTGVYSDVFHREESYELCKLLADGGAKKIQFNCHHVIKNIEKVQELKDHHHHIHFDGPKSTGSGPMLAGRFTTCGECALYSKCDVKIKKVKHDNEWKIYNPDRDANPRGKGAVKITDVE